MNFQLNFDNLVSVLEELSYVLWKYSLKQMQTDII